MSREAFSHVVKSPVLGLALLLLLLSPALADTIILQPIADTYSYSEEPATNFGAAAGIVSGVSTFLNPYAYAYLKFDLSAITAPVLGAKLWLYQVDGNAPFALGGTEALRLDTNSWTESGLTWDTAPPLAGIPLGSSPDSGIYKGWTSWVWSPSLADPVLDTTPGDDYLSLVIREDNSTTQGHVWLSRSYSAHAASLDLYGPGKEPYLEITTAAVAIPEPATLMMTGAALIGFASTVRKLRR